MAAGAAGKPAAGLRNAHAAFDLQSMQSLGGVVCKSVGGSEAHGVLLKTRIEYRCDG
jgi:hypothetical protein